MGETGGSSGETGGAAASGGSTPVGSGGSSIGGGGDIIGAAGNASNSPDAGIQACAGTKQNTKPKPVDIYIMLDQSGSMQGAGGGAALRWDPVTKGLKAFINDPANAGLGVAIQYFPLGSDSTADPNPAKCVVKNYATPDVPMGELPGNATPLIQSIDMHNFTPAQAEEGTHSGTPTRPALEGAIGYVREWLAQNPTHLGAVLLATDGYPTSDICGSSGPDSIDSVVAIATGGFTGMPSIPTYVIGLGNTQNLQKVAMAGGTTQAFIVPDNNANPEAVTKGFSDALRAIRANAIPCDYLIPTPEAGTIDPMLVNVEYTPSGGAVVHLGNAPDQAGCGSSDGWYFDNNQTPTKISMCAKTCATLKQNLEATIDIVFGCKTVPITVN